MRKWFNGKKPKPIRNIYAKAESFHRRAPGINFTQINLSIFFIFMCTTKFDERISISVKEGENPSTFIADMANDFAGWHTSKPGKSCQLKHFLSLTNGSEKFNGIAFNEQLSTDKYKTANTLA